MKWGRIFAFMVIVFLPASGSSTQTPYVCVGKYKDGSKPDQDALKIMLSDHMAWLGSERKGNDTRWANLCNANLSVADLSGANLIDVNLSRADLYDANLSGANLFASLSR